MANGLNTNIKTAREKKILAPARVHPAFEKAAHLLDLELVRIPLTDHFHMDVRALQKRIDKESLVVVCGAPSYPYGIIDPVEEMPEISKDSKWMGGLNKILPHRSRTLKK
ncbi:MAG: aminotransferase class I/II-fold pyridoxal phosphate-dependent enzyme [Bacteroidales bacterium]|nr:aminotransferase class I/II-fold pyridoxal phosphate-dependent enzyme [Bacteroidales bacterium]